MILLRDPARSVVTAVFGVGLVGSALVRRLKAAGPWESEALPFDWHDDAARRAQLERIEAKVRAFGNASSEVAVTLVWSAGQAGFQARREELSGELALFRAVLALGERCAEAFSPGRMRVVHFSSAGGLFEGQRSVDARSTPNPRRPYGELKAHQEDLLRRSGLPATIVRLSTVYGPLRAGQRLGLVSTLVANGVRREVSSIFGSMDTLRDFVWVDDVAAFVSRRLSSADGGNGASVVFLASGRPFSIFEIQKIVEDLLGHKLYVSHAPRATNSDDITFARSALPADWISSDLRTNLATVCREAIRSGQAFPTSAARFG